jgi:hypothetical protein
MNSGVAQPQSNVKSMASCHHSHLVRKIVGRLHTVKISWSVCMCECSTLLHVSNGALTLGEPDDMLSALGSIMLVIRAMHTPHVLEAHAPAIVGQ